MALSMEGAPLPDPASGQPEWHASIQELKPAQTDVSGPELVIVDNDQIFDDSGESAELCEPTPIFPGILNAPYEKSDLADAGDSFSLRLIEEDGQPEPVSMGRFAEVIALDPITLSVNDADLHSDGALAPVHVLHPGAETMLHKVEHGDAYDFALGALVVSHMLQRAPQAEVIDLGLPAVTDPHAGTAYGERGMQPDGEVIELNEHVRIRTATADDLDGLVELELAAFSDVYGKPPADDADAEEIWRYKEIVESVQQKYAQRIELLGDRVRILEDANRGVFGVMVCCPTSKKNEEFIGLDMTQNSFIEEAYDPDGKYMYVVNLAVLPNGNGGKALDLMNDAVGDAQRKGFTYAYFESRLPGFDRWRKKELPHIPESDLSKERIDELADQYWRLNIERSGRVRPKDMLLNMYVEFGCEPKHLVKDAWTVDGPSKAYGVLCEYRIPTLDERIVSVK